MTQLSNQFAQSPELGQIDLSMAGGQCIGAQVDASQATPLVAGQAVKLVDSVGGVPKVVAATTTDDEVYGFIAYNQKTNSYSAGDRVDLLAFGGGVLYLNSSAAIARGAHVMIDPATAGNVQTVAAGKRIVGHALDKATAINQLIRVVTFLPAAFKA